MKNRYIFCLLLLTNAGLQSMESETKLLSDWKSQENALANDFKALTERHLNDYEELATMCPDSLIERGKKFALSESKIKETLQAVRVKDGNTITHLLVMYKKFDEFIKFAQKDMLVLEKNEQGITALDLAFTEFFTLKNTDKTDTICDKRCFYLILLNHTKVKEDANYKKELVSSGGKTTWCCDTHSW